MNKGRQSCLCFQSSKAFQSEQLPPCLAIKSSWLLQQATFQSSVIHTDAMLNFRFLLVLDFFTGTDMASSSLCKPVRNNSREPQLQTCTVVCDKWVAHSNSGYSRLP